MGLRCNKHTNPYLYTLSYFVPQLKEELEITGGKSLQYKIKIGQVAMVADYVQMPHQAGFSTCQSGHIEVIFTSGM